MFCQSSVRVKTYRKKFVYSAFKNYSVVLWFSISVNKQFDSQEYLHLVCACVLGNALYIHVHTECGFRSSNDDDNVMIMSCQHLLHFSHLVSLPVLWLHSRSHISKSWSCRQTRDLFWIRFISIETVHFSMLQRILCVQAKSYPLYKKTEKCKQKWKKMSLQFKLMDVYLWVIRRQRQRRRKKKMNYEQMDFDRFGRNKR